MKVAVLTNVIPTYRKDFYNRVFTNESHEVTVFCQKSVPGSNLKPIHEQYGERVVLLKYWSPFQNDSLVFHFLPIFTLWKYDILVVDGNVRHVTMALLSTLFRLFGKKIVIWSNVYSAHGNSALQWVRRTWWRIFDNFLMYTEKDVEILNDKKFERKNIIAINNGLNQDEIDNTRSNWNKDKLEAFKKQHNIESQNIIISSGRVNKANNHALALEALQKVVTTIPDVLWVIIGNGTEIEVLKTAAQTEGLQNNILFLGEIYEEDKKSPWFLLSKVLIHPGFMGLTIFNSFGYSLPVIIHDNIMNHSPEVFLFEENKTGLLFKENDPVDLANKIIFALKNESKMEAMKQNVYNVVRHKNNTEIMSQQFFKMINTLK
ncbi:glycosyltransferase [Flavobacterium amnicola]|uniref:Glycosyltransferase n=1 Tax=Flavobacterium amnicola TaxID=2506422 RepID=A0A4Q1K0V8_9FLAO|nr:glycosyltransferase [Flavobacterium amnicola]RXR17787.1 glycosyltransferase [Flavobacterium amnicola]